jgi:hypothetical protein
MFFVFFLTAFSLYHLMVFRVNKHRPAAEKLPHSMSLARRDELESESKSLYPRSVIYQFTQLCAVTVILLAVAFVCFRVWDYAKRK